MISITVDFKDKDKFDQLLRYIEDNAVYGEAQEAMRVLGHHTADNMHDTINTQRVRPDKGSHKLENAITAETINTVGGIEVGVGRISKLKTEAPYYEMIDSGFTYSTKNEHVVHFVEGGKGIYPGYEGEFRTFKVGSSHTILGIDYVGKAIRNLDKELRETIEKLGSKLLNSMKQ